MALIQAKLGGVKEVTDKLRGMPDKVNRRVTKKMVTKGCKQLAKGMAARIQIRTAKLKRAMGSVIRFYRSGKVVGAVGALKGQKDIIGYRQRDGKKSKKGDPIYEDPAKIAHFAEKKSRFMQATIDEDGPSVINGMKQTGEVALREVLG